MSDDAQGEMAAEVAADAEERRRAAAGGCLSREQVASLQSAAPGQAPPEIARHLAACARCQERVLLGWDRSPARRASRPPSLQRSFVLVAAVLLALAMFFYSVLKLAGLAG